MSTTVELFAPPALRSAEPVVNFAKARTLVAAYGSPLLVISKSILTHTYQTMREHLPDVEFFYALKANTDRAILKALCKLGSSVDVCSHGELKHALKAGFQPEQMIHTHPCKTTSNLVNCYREGLRWFTYDTASELDKIREFAPDANLLLRLAVSSKSSVIDLSAKFGTSIREALPLLKRAGQLGLKARGLSFHVGSQCTSTKDYASALEQVRRLWDEATAAGVPLEVLDIGGGIPAPYREAILSLEGFCEALTQALKANFGDLNVRVIAEPGRGLVAEAVTLITTVIGKSVRNGRTWYIIDDGLYGSFSGKVYDHADFPLIAEGAAERALYPCVVAGPTCDSTDVVARDQLLPELDVGEILLVPTMGAYTSASASCFNGLDLARTVAIA